MTTVRLLARVLRVLILAGLVFPALPVGSALAQGTIGHTGTGILCGALRVWADRNYVVPPGGGTITDFSFQSTSINEGQRLAFLVLRPEGGTSYMVVGTTGPESLAGNGIETFTADIPVQAGDILGYWVPTGQNLLANCLQNVGSGGGAVQSLAQPSEPNVGETLSLPNATSTLALNVSATLVPASARPTSKAQCMNGGWMGFVGSNGQRLFRNQGDCVSFVSTGGRNAPSGPGAS